MNATGAGRHVAFNCKSVSLDHLASLDLSAVLVSRKAPFGCCYPKSVRRVLIRATAAPCSDKHAATGKVVCHWILDNNFSWISNRKLPPTWKWLQQLDWKLGHPLLIIQPREQQHPAGKANSMQRWPVSLQEGLRQTLEKCWHSAQPWEGLQGCSSNPGGTADRENSATSSVDQPGWDKQPAHGSRQQRIRFSCQSGLWYHEQTSQGVWRQQACGPPTSRKGNHQALEGL